MRRQLNQVANCDMRDAYDTRCCHKNEKVMDEGLTRAKGPQPAHQTLFRQAAAPFIHDSHRDTRHPEHPNMFDAQCLE